jgi:hypothetical protein
MARKSKPSTRSNPSGGTSGGIAGVPAGGTKAPRISGVGSPLTKAPRISGVGSPLRKGGNPGGTNQAGNDRVQGSSHRGSSSGKRNSG